MTKIIFTNTNCSRNKGSYAQVICTVKTLRKFIPDSEFTLISHYYDLDSKRCKIENLKIISSGWWRIPHHNKIIAFMKYFLFFPFCNILFAILFKIGLNPHYIKSPVIQEYIAGDMVVDLSGDSLADSKGAYSISNLSTILLGLSLRKKIVLFSQSIGPFSWATISLARYCLNKVNLIIIREEITKNYLQKIGIKSPIFLTADCAFLLEPVSNGHIKAILFKERIETVKKPIVGLSVNAVLALNANYIFLMAQIIEYIIDRWNANIVIIPHVISMRMGGRGDDRLIGEKLFKMIKNKEKISLIKGDHSPDELKGIIGLCDIFIGGRMHANIAALSSYVPTLVIGWSPKYYGIMKALGQEKYVCDYETMDFHELISKLNDIWYNKEKIRNELRFEVENQKELAWFSGELVNNELNNCKEKSQL